MTDKEKTLAFIEERIKWNEDMMQRDPKPSDIGRIEEAKCIRRFIESLQEEPVSEDLEEAAFDYAESCKYEGGDKLLCVEHFKAGVKWQKEQFEKDYTNLCNGIATVKGLAVAMTYNKGVADTKEQMMEKAVETTFNVSLPSGLYDKLWIKGCKESDKLLVIKKDEL